MDHFSAELPRTELSHVKIRRGVDLVKTTLSPTYCQSVIKDCEKNLKGTLSQKGFNVKNLTGAYKSETWQLHMEEWFLKHRDILLQRLCDMIKSRVGTEDFFSIHMIESWYAKYTDESIVAPHSHNIFHGHWSFCWYLGTAPEGTLLYFMDGSESFPHRFFPGNLILFPGDLMHWSNDTSKDRKIISGNFLLTVEPLQVVEARNNKE